MQIRDIHTYAGATGLAGRHTELLSPLIPCLPHTAATALHVRDNTILPSVPCLWLSWSWKLSNVTTSRQFFTILTWLQCGSASSARSPPWFTRSLIGHTPSTWLMTTASPPTPTQEDWRPHDASSRTWVNFGYTAFSVAFSQLWSNAYWTIRQQTNLITIIIKNLYSAIMPLGDYRGAGGTGRQNS